MESDARYAWVGAAILALAGLLATAVWWLQGGEGQEVKRYLVYFQNQSLEGLQINSDVRMQGIKVGKVVDYVILPKQAKTVRVVLEVDARTPVLEGVEAVVSRNLVTGLAAIDLNNTWKGGQAHTQVAKGEEYPVIGEGVPEIARFAKSLEGLGTAGTEVLGRVNTLLSDDNQRAIAASLDNLAGLSAEARQLVPELSDTLAAARQMATRLDGTLAEVGPLLQDTGTLVRQTGQRLDSLAGEAETTLRATRASLAGLDTSLHDIRMQLRLTADLGLQEMQRGVTAVKDASESFEISSRQFADPGLLLYGPHAQELGPGEKP